MSGPRHGIEAVTAEAMAEAGEVPALQPMLPLADPEAIVAAIDGGARPDQVMLKARKAGRPRGALNKRTAVFRERILGRFAHPGEALASAYSRPVDVLAAELGCTKLEAFQVQVRAAAELLPYVESKMPVAVGVSAEGQIQLVLAAQGGDGARIIDATASLTGLEALAMLGEENQGVSEG